MSSKKTKKADNPKKAARPARVGAAPFKDALKTKRAIRMEAAAAKAALVEAAAADAESESE